MLATAPIPCSLKLPQNTRILSAPYLPTIYNYLIMGISLLSIQFHFKLNCSIRSHTRCQSTLVTNMFCITTFHCVYYLKSISRMYPMYVIMQKRSPRTLELNLLLIILTCKADLNYPRTSD